jgi:hypothetical protein
MMKFLVIIIFAIFPLVTFGQLEGNPENWCRNGFFPRESKDYSLGTVKAKKGERVYFYGDEENCPNGKNCRKKAYLIGGNEVIISRKFGNWACSWYQPKNGSETVGWIALKNLEFTNMVQGIESYAGTWRFYDNEIEIKKTANPKVFEIKGTALWKGVGDNVHVGELDGKAVWTEKVLAYGEGDQDEYACKVTFDLVGSYLVVSDNLNCGGLNVTFSGVYRKR